jgi:HAD superfamily phosphoserine phosphatase-like hydrolase
MLGKEMAEAKQIIVLDWDGVLRPGFLVIDWAEHLKNQAAFPPENLRLMQDQLRGYHDKSLSYAEIAHTIPELYAKGLQGLKVDEHMTIATEYIASHEFLTSLTPLAGQLLRFVQKAPDVDTVIISGAPESVLRPFGESVGIHEVRAVRVQAEKNIFTGHVLDNPAIMDRKQELIARYSSQRRILLAVGDSESDQPMLIAADHRIAVGSILASEWQGKPNTLILPRGDLSERNVTEVESFLCDLERR